jgi:hypothetical protein
MSYYIQRKDSRYLETVDEFPYRSLARKMLTEYQMADPAARYYISTRCCANWKDRSVSKVVRPTTERPPIPVPFGHPV